MMLCPAHQPNRRTLERAVRKLAAAADLETEVSLSAKEAEALWLYIAATANKP